jgi:hypothetical protein
MRNGDIVLRVRGMRFDHQDAERVAAFIKALTLLLDARFVRITHNVVVLRPRKTTAGASA